jgi:hypothetical protein
MYRVYWANMARSMDGVWKVLAPITVAGTVIAGVHRNYLPATWGLSMAFLVVLWGINVTIDLNAWHRRNLFFCTKAERQFLGDSDYGQVLPASYRAPKQGWIAFYTINVFVFTAFLVLTVGYAISQKLNSRTCLVPGIVLIVGVPLTLVHAASQERSAARHRRELFDTKQDGSPRSS